MLASERVFHITDTQSKDKEMSVDSLEASDPPSGQWHSD